MDYEKIKGIIEAILFTMGEAVSVKQLSDVIEIEEDKVWEILYGMREEYKAENKGVCLIFLEDSVQLCTKPELFDYIKALIAQPKKRTLTDVMLETLSIIAYKQPVTKQEIEAIRGVKSDFAVNKLIEYDLVRETGRKETLGRPILFGTTEEFLRCFGVSSAKELPAVDEVKKQSFMAEAMDEISSVNLEV